MARREATHSAQRSQARTAVFTALAQVHPEFPVALVYRIRRTLAG